MKKVLLLPVFSLAAGIFNPVFASVQSYPFLSKEGYDVANAITQGLSVEQICSQLGSSGCTAQDSTMTCIYESSMTSSTSEQKTIPLTPNILALFKEGKNVGFVCQEYVTSAALLNCGGCLDKIAII